MLQQHGDIKFIKAYGNWSSRNALWKKVLNQYGVEASHRYNITQRKNAADISLAVSELIKSPVIPVPDRN